MKKTYKYEVPVIKKNSDSDFYNILSFNWLLLMKKTYKYEVPVIKKNSDSGKK